MAEIMQRSGLSFRIYRGLAKLVSVSPGGLLQTNIAGCAMFAAISGSSVATAAAIGTVALPQLTQRGYHRRLAAGSLAAGGTLGILVPPSIALIVYGTFTETSVSKLFMAGIVPGVLLTAMFMAYICVHALLRPEIAPRERGPQNVGEFVTALGDLLPFVVVIGGTLGSLYTGWATPTEAAAIGCVTATVVSSIWGQRYARRIARGHDRGGQGERQHPADRLHRLRLFLRHQRGGRGRVAHDVAGWPQAGAARILLRPVHPLHGPRLPGRKPGHDRDHGASCSIRCC